jgi:hypothetical protein
LANRVGGDSNPFGGFLILLRCLITIHLLVKWPRGFLFNCTRMEPPRLCFCGVKSFHMDGSFRRGVGVSHLGKKASK